MTQRETQWTGEPEETNVTDTLAHTDDQSVTRPTRTGSSKRPKGERSHTSTSHSSEAVMETGVKRTSARRGTTKKIAKSDETKAIIALPVLHQSTIDEEQHDTAEREALESQGFTADEAVRLIHVSDRLAHSREARESEATLRRLRFTRWLIEHGVLNEFSA